MKITSDIEDRGKHYLVEYEDCDDWMGIPNDLWNQHYGVCFLDGQIILGLHGSTESPRWHIIGGGREFGESFEETLVREILEESNMDIVEHIPIGYQKVTHEDGKVEYQLRSWCRVKPRGPFVSDPDNGVHEIKLIDPKEYKQYFDWGTIGDRIMERAMEIDRSRQRLGEQNTLNA